MSKQIHCFEMAFLFSVVFLKLLFMLGALEPFRTIPIHTSKLNKINWLLNSK